MWFNQTGNISTLNGSTLKLDDKFTYLGSSVSSTETDISTWLAKAWTAIDRLSVIWKSDLIDKMKCSFCQAVIVSILLYGCTTWMLTKRMEKKLDSNYTRMLWAILNKSWRQHPTKQQLYGHLPPITNSIKVRRTRHVWHSWRSRDELVSDVLLWTPSHGRAKAGRPARTYIQQLCANTKYSPEDLPKARDDREVWRERVRNIRADNVTWWWRFGQSLLLVYATFTFVLLSFLTETVVYLHLLNLLRHSCFPPYFVVSFSSSSVSSCSSSGISTSSGSNLALNWSAWANIGCPFF